MLKKTSAVRDKILHLVRRIVGTQMIADMLRDRGRPNDWIPYASTDALGKELERRIVDNIPSERLGKSGCVNKYILRIITAQVSNDYDVHEVIWDVYKELSRTRDPGAIVLAEIINKYFKEALVQSNIELEVVCRYYDILYGLYHWGASRFIDMARFDSEVVIPFSEWLNTNYPAARSGQRASLLGKSLRVGYLCTYAHLEKGNAITPLIQSIVLEHAHRPNRHIFMYCIGWSSSEFVSSFDGTGVTVRDVPQGHVYTGLDMIVDCIRADQIDVLITDTGTAVPTYVFSRRVAPVQIWMEMGYPYWSIAQLDWVLLAGRQCQSYYGIPTNRWSPMIDRCAADLMHRPVTDSQIAEARNAVKAGGYVMACFTRLAKMSVLYLRLIRRLLRNIPSSRFVIVGAGSSHEVEALLVEPEFWGRVTLINELVDINVYSKVIDVFLDTFPFAGGGAVREALICGVPVVAMRGGDYDEMVVDQRDHSLCAWSDDEYCDIVLRLATDVEFSEACRRSAKEIGERVSRVEDAIEPIEYAIEKAIKYVSAKEERESPQWTNGKPSEVPIDKL